jgi:hypothetical protein
VYWTEPVSVVPPVVLPVVPAEAAEDVAQPELVEGGADPGLVVDVPGDVRVSAGGALAAAS